MNEHFLINPNSSRRPPERISEIRVDLVDLIRRTVCCSSSHQLCALELWEGRGVGSIIMPDCCIICERVQICIYRCRWAQKKQVNGAELKQSCHYLMQPCSHAMLTFLVHVLHWLLLRGSSRHGALLKCFVSLAWRWWWYGFTFLKTLIKWVYRHLGRKWLLTEYLVVTNCGWYCLSFISFAFAWSQRKIIDFLQPCRDQVRLTDLHLPPVDV